MNRSEFWELIDAARSGAPDDEAFMVRIASAIRSLPPASIMAFEGQFNQVQAESYTWRLWGAAYLLNGGCSNDGFDYFRAWLIAQGRSTFERCLNDPDALADLAEPESELELEEFLYVADIIYEEKTGEQMPMSVVVKDPELGPGWGFDDRHEMCTRYPRLFARGEY